MTHPWNKIGTLMLRLALGVMYVAHGACYHGKDVGKVR
jgi:hypothetical protein